MISILGRFRKPRCCECGEKQAVFRPLFEWSTGKWVCLFCANVHGYLEYIKLE